MLLARRYQLIEPLGEGGLASAYRASDLALGTDVCVKLLGSSGHREVGSSDVELLRREFDLLRGLVHPNLVRVHDFVFAVDAGQAFFTSDIARGRSLRDFVRQRDATQVTHALVGVARALAFLHRHGLLHNDVKPENILVDDDGNATLIDLSCASRAVTGRSAYVSGTPGFIAPERLVGGAVDERADLFSFGVTMRELGVGPTALVARMTAERAVDRPASAREVLELLDAAFEGDVRGDAVELAPFVGRANEVERFARALDDLRTGREGPRVIELRGPTGSGRSRLLSELKWNASLEMETVEGFSWREGGVRSLFVRATGIERLGEGASGAVMAHDELRSRSAPLVVFLDDADAASKSELELGVGFARLLEPGDPVLFVVSRDAPAAPWIDVDSLRIELGALSNEAARAWLEGAGFADESERVIGVMGTMPGALTRAVLELRRGVPPMRMVRDPARVSVLPDAPATLDDARALQWSGEPGLAMAMIERVDNAPTRERLALLATCLLELGDARKALETIDAEAEPRWSRRDRADIEAVRARALVRLGRHAEALSVARSTLEEPDLPGALLGELNECAGAAAMYTDDLVGAARHLDVAVGLLRTSGSPRSVVRAETYRGISAFRRGALEDACAAYEAALAGAEEHGLSDQIARAALNLGTARHQRGELARALAAYERGERIAKALGQRDLLLILGFDLAKLYADLGAFAHAEAKAERVRARAESSGAAFFEAAALSVLGDVAEATGRVELARASFERARDGFARLGAKRETCEEELELARLSVVAGRIDLARSHLASARAGQTISAMSDLEVRAVLVEARLVAAEGDLARARALTADAFAIAERASQSELAARALALGADLASRAADGDEARALRTRAREGWSTMTVGLAPALIEAFWRRPERILPLDAPKRDDGMASRNAKLERLIAAFRRLNSSVETNAVLSLALDEAIDVTGAERGFLLLDRNGEVGVAVARNITRDPLSGDGERWSRSIAERAIATAEPVVTVDADVDPRFTSNVSVHAMRLCSVIAVPIRSPSGVLGALYLDNRYQRARFDQADTDLLLAFADQVALAIENARLVEALKRRGEELLASRRKVEELAADQAQEIVRLHEEVRQRQEVLEHRFDYSAIVGRSPAMSKVFSLLDRVIDTPLSVLVTGESGTGKELVARAIHFGSKGKDKPFVGINCAALPPNLLESELFGHVRGAFTGADRDRVGLVVAAKGGTLFLDELGEMPLEIQAKLLRVLQEHEVRPLGSAKSEPVDFRLVTATNRDLGDEVARGRFREDLYYRVGVVEIRLPALRERIEDLPELCRHFVARIAAQLGREPPRIGPGALLKLSRYGFPGNIRELENLITKALVLGDGDAIQAADIDVSVGSKSPRAKKSSERATLLAALEHEGWNAVRAAKSLGMPRATFYRRLAALGIERPERRRP